MMNLKSIILLLFAFIGSKNLCAQDYIFNLIDQTWMLPDLTLRQFSQDDTIKFGTTIFIKKDHLDNFIPDGWSLPSEKDIITFIKNLDGKKNDKGSTLISAINLSQIIPYKLNGIYYDSMKQLIGVNSITAYYTALDIEKMFNSEKDTTQVSLYIHSNRYGELNIEPMYTKVKNGQIYCNVLFIKKIKN